MIRLKTSVLVAAALQMGAIVAETSEANAQLMYAFGLNLGLAFKLQDDYLDTFGDPETFGKQIAGDIIENKKTFLFLKCIAIANEEDQQKLAFFFKQKLEDNSIKIAEVTRIFELYEIPALVKEQINDYTEKAFKTLEGMKIDAQSKQNLKNFGLWLMNRSV